MRNGAGILVFGVAQILYSCETADRTASMLERDLEVIWELNENQFGENEKCQTTFHFMNHGKRTIKSGTWQLYFNQKTLFPLAPADSSIGTIRHVNGDLYVFAPGPSFEILPEDSLAFSGEWDGIIVKRSDAPAGLYFAVGRKQEALVAVNRYTIRPFIPVEKRFPGYDRFIPSPESEFFRNQSLTLLSPEKTIPIIPTPNRVVKGIGKVTVSESTTIYCTMETRHEAGYLASLVQSLFGASLRIQEGESSGSDAIRLRINRQISGSSEGEAYRLEIKPSVGITITGSDAAGVFYGIQSLLALVPPESFSGEINKVSFDAITLMDSPRFAFRGFLLDVARNFHDKTELMKLIDLLAFYKINALNLRLTDDEGWRIEILKLPELTQTGARRGHVTDGHSSLPPAYGSGPFPGSAGNRGTGYYTREDFREILRYANDRHVSIIPEICFPSHARAAIMSMEARYLHHKNAGNEKAAMEYRLIDPDDKPRYYSAQLYRDNIVCVALESAYHFYETVIRDIAAQYNEAGVPLIRFHTGGDEVPRGAWDHSPLCLQLIEENPELQSTSDLQSYFFGRILSLLNQMGIEAGGWEEVALLRDLIGGSRVNDAFSASGVVPYVWDNTGSNIDLGYRLANAGYPVILCNVTNLYFDLAYNPHPEEPGLYWGGFQNEKDPFLLIPFDVFKSAVYDEFGNFTGQEFDASAYESLTEAGRRNIKGLQAQLWSETVKSNSMLEYYMLPKLFAFAERAWAAAPAWESEKDMQIRTSQLEVDWNEFVNRIGQRELQRLDYLFGGFEYRVPAPGARIVNGYLQANVPFPGLEIRYTTDGSEPGPKSELYTEPVKITGTAKLKVFSKNGRGGMTSEIKPK